MFPGFVEKAHNHTWSSWFTGHSQVAVRVAINTSGVWVIDIEKKVKFSFIFNMFLLLSSTVIALISLRLGVILFE